MSSYVHYVAEYRYNGKWTHFSMPACADDDTIREHPEKVFEINGEKYTMDGYFCIPLLTLRDNYFTNYPWRKSKHLKSGIPSDATKETRDVIAPWEKYHFYNCSLEDMDAEATEVFNEWKEMKKHEDVMDFSVEFARRLGFGKEESYDEGTAPEKIEQMDTLLDIHGQLRCFIDAVTRQVANAKNFYIVEPEDIRVVIWIA